GYKGLTTCVERITHWVIRPTRRLFANALSALTKSEYCAIFAQYSGNMFIHFQRACRFFGTLFI
ncbi:MAG: hypothetical protein KKG09_02970, partial [Verrucomicrobia bacterium]|nr:hypothetical protein [Verrucomicrobiota bacterium]MBU4496956.1 hypothetical protein [Verrucomicrobiota bacterium]